jgi:hypothetical protein
MKTFELKVRKLQHMFYNSKFRNKEKVRCHICLVVQEIIKGIRIPLWDSLLVLAAVQCLLRSNQTECPDINNCVLFSYLIKLQYLQAS